MSEKIKSNGADVDDTNPLPTKSILAATIPYRKFLPLPVYLLLKFHAKLIYVALFLY